MERFYRSPKMYCAVLFVTVLSFSSLSSAKSIVFRLEESPTLHNTELELTVQLKEPLPEKILVDTDTVSYNLFRAEIPVEGRKTVHVKLRPEDFRFVKLTMEGNVTFSTLVWSIINGLNVTTDGQEDSSIVDVKAKFTGDNGVVYPWENDPTEPLSTEGGMNWWPGVGYNKKTAGHFGWMYEPNGLLINNVSFDRIERSWYYFKPKREASVGKNIHGLNLRESFQFNFGIPGALQPKPRVVVKEKEEAQGKAGMKFRIQYEVDKGVYQNDDVQADWTSFCWKRKVNTAVGITYDQELRYSILALGIQVETDAPAFQVSFQDDKTTRGPAGVILPTAEGVRLITDPKELDPKQMVKNWIVLLHNDGSPEIPTMLVFQHRPDRFTWGKENLTIHRAAGVGTLAIGNPFGATVQDAETLAVWSKNPTEIPLKRFEPFANLLAAYPWKCREQFAVKDGWVYIRDEMTFLPWSDDWGTKPSPYSPLPPLVSYSVMNDILPKTSVHDVEDLDIVTKWGPYWARKGERQDYKLPVPRAWGYMPLDIVPTTDEDKWFRDVVTRSVRREAMEKFWNRFPDSIGGDRFPHYPVFEQASGAWFSANYMRPEDRVWFQERMKKMVLPGFYPQSYCYRKDPISGEEHLVIPACTRGEPYVVNGENAWDNNYWEGLTMYGIYMHTKYGAMWDTTATYWPQVRSPMSYWETMHSWALMAPGAREAGLYWGADMCTAGYGGLVAFRNMAERLGTPYQRDLATYLLSLNAVPRVATFGFSDWAKKLSHQEPGTIVGGFGEQWVCSNRIALSAKITDHSYNDPWWCSGLLGPCGVLPEMLDLFAERDPKRCIEWEKRFMEQCPDEDFRHNSYENYMPHATFRTYLEDEGLRRGARNLLYQGMTEYSMRHIHTIPILLNWDVPVRLLDWAPGYISSGCWDAKTQTATIGVEAETQPAKVKLALRPSMAEVLLDGASVPTTQVDSWKDWRVVECAAPPGKHTLVVCPKKTTDPMK